MSFLCAAREIKTSEKGILLIRILMEQQLRKPAEDWLTGYELKRKAKDFQLVGSYGRSQAFQPPGLKILLNIVFVSSFQ